MTGSVVRLSPLADRKPWWSVLVLVDLLQSGNWIHLAALRVVSNDREHAAHGKSIKDIYVYPLCRQTQTVSQCVPPVFADSRESDAFV